MAGLVPAIHVFPCSQDVDARHKAGHDGARKTSNSAYELFWIPGSRTLCASQNDGDDCYLAWP